MNRIDDVMLMAYVDGEVDASTAREIETAIHSDSTLARRVRMFRDSASMMRGAYTEVLHEPVPEHLLAAIRSTPAATSTLPPVAAGGGENVVPMRPKAAAPRASGWRTAAWSAAAAALAVAVFAAGNKTGFVRIAEPPASTQLVVAGPDSERWVENLAGYFREYQGILEREKRLLVDFGAEHVGELEKWFSARLNRPLAVPDLSTFGYRPNGGRFVIVAGKPAAQLLYTGENNELVALVVAVTDLPGRSGRLDQRGDVNVVHWRENGYAYAFVGRSDWQKLWRMADATWAKLKPV
jgi:anti-sigma factor RsiW